MVLYTRDFRIADSLRKKLKKIQANADGRWEVRFDSAFEQVMRACAGPRRDGAGTWISEEIVAGYTALARLGYAHSSELWCDGELVGGAYGVSIGAMFFGESMFARVTDASKIALAYLVAFLRARGVELIDCQQETGHLASLGAAPIPRKEFLHHLRRAVEAPQLYNWGPEAPF
jgi:leucyl/phenylalanyl-tRNA--protein transferase